MSNIVALLIATSILLTSCADSSTGRQAHCRDIGELPSGDLLMFGEMHGSVEAPALIAEVACHLSIDNEIAIGLEIPTSEQERIDDYLASNGTKEDEDRLTASTFWQNGNDGRSSIAMLNLLRSIRTLDGIGHPIDVFAFDEQLDGRTNRDVAIATGIRRYRDANPSKKIVALMGNIHAMQETFTIEDVSIIPSGQLLKDLNPLSVLIAYPKGTVWACMPDCTVHSVAPQNPLTGPSGFREGSTLTGYSHTYLLNSITASPPAIGDGG
jgi:hypothetical protein